MDAKRILTNRGRAVFRAKLRDLEERYGATHTEVHAAYSSQTCSHCGWVEKNTRRSQSEFRCRCCGHRMHADVNAARNLGTRRSCSTFVFHDGEPAAEAGVPSSTKRSGVLPSESRAVRPRRRHGNPLGGAPGVTRIDLTQAGSRITLPSVRTPDLVAASAKH